MPPRTSGHVPELRQLSQPDGADRPDSRHRDDRRPPSGRFFGGGAEDRGFPLVQEVTCSAQPPLLLGVTGMTCPLLSSYVATLESTEAILPSLPHPLVQIIDMDWSLARRLSSGLRRLAGWFDLVHSGYASG